MAPRPPNYQQERNDRNRAKEQKKRERLERREQDAQRRRAEREGLLAPQPDADGSDTPSEVR